MFGHEANVRVVGLDVTHSCQFTAEDLAGLAGQGRFGTFLQQIARFYLQYHRWPWPALHLPALSGTDLGAKGRRLRDSPPVDAGSLACL